ncbi:hypothetical protein [Motilibacter deserti]|uniref:DUF4190 domain-containing protein n=1 Tax=Motilibacter deserti TaxID=2714956 RepID=A0ABX0H3I9_9ACTN|nr:hypothetical protein [Motilibacter deserti]NHC15948.1 hypothetical protein [Motilibacter deserti]
MENGDGTQRARDGERPVPDDNPWAAPPEGEQAGQRPAPPRPAPPQPPSSFWGRPARGEGGPGSPQRRPTGPVVSGGRPALLLALVALPALASPEIGVILAVGALVLAALAIREARRQRGTAPGAVAALVVGSCVVSLGVSTLVTSALPGARDYRECREQALTHAARAECDERYEDERSPFGLEGAALR